ncbi:hypothetical protein [Pengzhenrongella phosphoraccumulans]|uniref:hypothetical protein n=1 Tax=Pengzhenrongella phosphoraccumulans TaxID=3114394 RepID=UPI00388ECB4E
MPHLIAALALVKMFLTPQSDDHPDRGSVTVEHVLWAVAVIGIVGVVVAAINAYVNAQAGLIT